MAKAKKQREPLKVQALEGETEAGTMARLLVDPFLRHGIVGSAISDKMMGKLPGEPRFDDFSLALKAKVTDDKDEARALANAMLTAQALSLDAMFTELSRRATMNMGDYPQATERYARLALKAQSNCRASIEALTRLYQPREQTVRHVHVNEGGQAIVADEFHQHRGGTKNGKNDTQCLATEQSRRCASLPSPDPIGNGVPISSRERQETVPDARR